LAVALCVCPAAPSAASAGGAHTRCRDSTLSPTASDGPAIARATLCLINIDRSRHHLAALRSNRALARIAAGQSWDMVRGNYFADHSLEGRTPLERIVPALLPERVATTAQNIGWGTGADATPEGIVRAWMESAPHRRILLTASYREAGVGVTPALPAMLERGTSGATYALDLTAFATSTPAPATSPSQPRSSTQAATGRTTAGSEGPSAPATTKTAQAVTAG
jgi:hypothetical protein